MNKTTRPIYMLPIRKSLQKDTHRLNVEEWKKIISVNRNEKKAGVAIKISDKQTLKQRLSYDKEGYYIMLKGSIQQEDITFINIYAPNIGAPKYTMQILTDLKGKIKSNKIVGDLHTQLLAMDRSPGQRNQ